MDESAEGWSSGISSKATNNQVYTHTRMDADTGTHTLSLCREDWTFSSVQVRDLCY